MTISQLVAGAICFSVIQLIYKLIAKRREKREEREWQAYKDYQERQAAYKIWVETHKNYPYK